MSDGTSLLYCEHPERKSTRKVTLLYSSFCPRALPHNNLYLLITHSYPAATHRAAGNTVPFHNVQCLPCAGQHLPYPAWSLPSPCLPPDSAAHIGLRLPAMQVLLNEFTNEGSLHPSGPHPSPACPDSASFLLTGSGLRVQGEPEHHESQQRGEDSHPGNHPSLPQGQTTPG